MSDDGTTDAGRRVILRCLDTQRASVLAVVEGLSDDAWQTPAVPSGWTPAGLVQHLGDAERHWFVEVLTGVEDDLPWDEGRGPYDPSAPFICTRPPSQVVAYYREQCARSDELIRGLPLSAPTKGTHGDPQLDSEITDLLTVVLHMIEETACHSGHLDIARELIDGRTDLALR